MLDLDQRVTEGLRDLAGRAPVTADVWPATEQYVGKRRRARRAVGGGALALVLVAGGFTAVAMARHAPSRVRTAEPGPSETRLPHTGPIDGPLPVITASATGGLTFSPDRLTVHTGVYELSLRGGSNAEHTLFFEDPSTRWSPLRVGTFGETSGGRIFFGRPGDYTFYCAIAGHRAAGMTGVVHVTGKPMTLEQAEESATGFAYS